MALEIFKLVGSVFVDTKDAEKSLQKTDKTAEGFGSKLLSVGKTAGKFALGVAGAAVAAGGAIVALTESTREYRTEQGKLQAAFEVQNFTAEEARKTYTALNGVLGDSGQAVEAANHLAKLCDTEKELQTWTDICTGVYATFGDSLPIEGLTEAANETAKTGALTGSLADALNWAGVNEEDFQKKLEKCNSEQERTKLITETLNGLYSEASDKYKELNADVIAANEAQDRLNGAMAAVGGAMEPFVTKGKELLAEVLELLVPVLEYVATTVLPWVSNAFSVVSGWVQDLIGKLGDSGITFDTVMKWIQTAFETAMSVIKQYWEAYGKPVWNFIKQAVGLVADYFKQRMPQIQEFVRTCFTDIKRLWENNLKPALEAVGNFITNVLAPAFKWVFENVITPVADAAFRGIGQLWTNTLKPLLENMIDFIKNVFSGNFAGAWQNVLNSFGRVWEGIKTVIKAPLNAAIGIVNNFIGKLNGIKIPSWVPGVGGKAFSMPTIPYLYNGGILKKGQVGVLEGSGDEAVVPLHRNKQWISAVARDMDAAMGTSGGQTVALLQDVRDLLEQLVGAGIYMDTGALVGALARPMDKKLGQIQAAKARA
jgi:hypothetical protein